MVACCILFASNSSSLHPILRNNEPLVVWMRSKKFCSIWHSEDVCIGSIMSCGYAAQGEICVRTFWMLLITTLAVSNVGETLQKRWRCRCSVQVTLVGSVKMIFSGGMWVVLLNYCTEIQIWGTLLESFLTPLHFRGKYVHSLLTTTCICKTCARADPTIQLYVKQLKWAPPPPAVTLHVKASVIIILKYMCL